jgi:putative serine protease PepD
MRYAKPLIVTLAAWWFLACVCCASAITDDENNNIELYERLSPAVVCITSTVIEHILRRAVTATGTGAGEIIDPRGYILTNKHVIGSGNIEVQLANGRKYRAHLIGSDRRTDLAVVKIDAPQEELTTIPMGDSAKLRVGQKALSIGDPFGLDNSLTVGVISSVGRTIKATNGFLVKGVIQTDAAINPGNSGGPLIDSSGKMIGITTAIFSPTGASVGIGFAIPIDLAKKVVHRFVQGGYYSYSYLGASLMNLAPVLAEQMQLPIKSGAIVTALDPGGPAQKAGLKGGLRMRQVGNDVVLSGADVIVSVNGVEVTGAQAAEREIHRRRPGERVLLGIVRGDGTSEILAVTLGQRPPH